MFKRLLSANRCLVPADGYYEWKKTLTGKILYWIRMADESPFFFAGLWDWWHEKDPEGIPSFTILTTDANGLTMPIHNRMPVIVPKEDYNLWLDPKVTHISSVAHVLRPYEGNEMTAYPVGIKVNNVKNDGPELIKPIS
jgi:putative SOS response-associated peptidase YedK